MAKRKGFTKHRYFTKDKMHELVDQAIGGDQTAYRLLFERFKPIMYSIAKKRMYNAKNVDDIEDEVLIFLGRMFTKNIHKFDKSKAQFDTWLTHCFNMHLNTIPRRKKRVELTTIDDLYGPNEDDYREYPIPEDGKDTTNLINGTMSFTRICRILLTHVDKPSVKIVMDKFWYGLNDKELTIKYNLAKNTAWSKYTRALVKCRAVLEKYYSERL
jgi:DNA-directed RNA polymerase specialized sigma24 family protein